MNNTLPDYPIHVGASVKALGNGIVEGILVPFTSADQRDLHGEYFTRDTDLGLNEPVPVVLEGMRAFYQHALDTTIGAKSVGRVIKAWVDDAGVWVRIQLELYDEYMQKIDELAQAGKLSLSSGALPQSVSITKDKWIKVWKLIEPSLTPTPAMPFLTKITSLKAYHDAIKETPIEPEEYGNTARL